MTQGSIVRIMVAKNNFDLKPTFRLMVQGIINFDGLIDEGPNANIGSFMELCDMLKINGYQTMLSKSYHSHSIER